jgi:hypothetical protein
MKQLLLLGWQAVGALIGVTIIVLGVTQLNG